MLTISIYNKLEYYQFTYNLLCN